MKKTLRLLMAVAAMIPTLGYAQTYDEYGVITAPPANAKKTTYCRNSIGLQLSILIAEPENFEAYGWACDLYEDGNTVYMANPLCSYPMDTYTKGTKTDKGISFPMPQPIYHYEQNGKQETFTVDLYMFDNTQGGYVPDRTPNRTFDLELQESGDYKFDYVGVHTDSSMMGTYYYTDYCLGLTEGSTSDYLGISELTLRLIPFDNTMVQAPADLATEQYQFTYGYSGHYVNIGIKGEDIYIQGMNEYQPENWVKGTIKDNVASFPSMQYLGVADGLTVFFSGAEKNGEDTVGTDTLVMDYDPKSNTYSPRQLIWLTSTPEKDETFVLYESPEFKPVPEKLDPNICAPIINSVMNYDKTLEFGRIKFHLNGLNKVGDVLPSDRISYAAYIDEEIYTLDPADYTRLSEEMEWIPYSFTDNWDILVYDRGERTLYFYAEAEDVVGIQARYLDDNGELHYSPVANYYLEGSAVEKVEDNAVIVSETNYDIMGRPVSNTYQGLSIRVLKMSDGTTRSIKNFRK